MRRSYGFRSLGLILITAGIILLGSLLWDRVKPLRFPELAANETSNTPYHPGSDAAVDKRIKDVETSLAQLRQLSSRQYYLTEASDGAATTITQIRISSFYLPELTKRYSNRLRWAGTTTLEESTSAEVFNDRDGRPTMAVVTAPLDERKVLLILASP